MDNHNNKQQLDSELRLRDVLRKNINLLAPVYGERESRALMMEAILRIKGWNTVDVAVHQDSFLSDFITKKIDDCVERLLNYEPIQYIFSVAHFYGMDFMVNQHTLIPREETASLVDMIVKDNRDKTDLHILDIATGSGCIAISLARNLRFPIVEGTDISEAALDVAKENAKRLKVNVEFSLKDIMKMTVGQADYDVIVSNPPYIAYEEKKGMERNVIDYEPWGALFIPDDDPLKFYKPIVDLAVKGLKPSGKLYLEINPLFAEDLRKLAVSAGLEEVTLHNYLDGKIRFLTALKPSE